MAVAALKAILPDTHSVSQIVHDWYVSLAQLELDCRKAGEDDAKNEGAIERDERRTDALMTRLEAALPVSINEIGDLIHLARELMKHGCHDPEQVKLILRKASDGCCEQHKRTWPDYVPANSV